jgi:hypothetical protein
VTTKYKTIITIIDIGKRWQFYDNAKTVYNNNNNNSNILYIYIYDVYIICIGYNVEEIQG